MKNCFGPKFFLTSLATSLLLTCLVGSVSARFTTSEDDIPLATNSLAASQKGNTLALRPFEAKYIAIRSGNNVGSASLLLQAEPLSSESDSALNNALASALNSALNHDSSLYSLVYESHLKRFFLSDKRYEKSYFTTHQDTLIPISYEYKRTGTGPDKALRVLFDIDDSVLLIDDSEKMTWNGEFDNQLFRVDLPHKLAAGESNVSYDFINYRGEKRHYALEVVSTENLTLPYGKLMAMKVKINRESSSRVTYAWFAPSLNHNLVRLQQFKDGKEQGDMQLSEFSFQ